MNYVYSVPGHMIDGTNLQIAHICTYITIYETYGIYVKGHGYISDVLNAVYNFINGLERS